MTQNVVTLGNWSGRNWMKNAPCVGKTHLFFAKVAERPQARTRREAKASKLCQECDSRIQCRDFAREHREFGFWGGENEEQRTNAGYPVPNPIGSRRRVAAS
jgi:WhiB family transcriptional regulator, redox-sensing transcriptional regulator